MTKKTAAGQVFFVAQRIRDAMQGDDDADVWAMLLEAVAHDLDPTNRRYIEEPIYRDDRPSVRVKLRRLIEHPTTPQPEREAALHALARLNA